MLSSRMTLVLDLRGHGTRKDIAESCIARLRKETDDEKESEAGGPWKAMMSLEMRAVMIPAS